MSDPCHNGVTQATFSDLGHGSAAWVVESDRRNHGATQAVVCDTGPYFAEQAAG